MVERRLPHGNRSDVSERQFFAATKQLLDKFARQVKKGRVSDACLHRTVGLEDVVGVVMGLEDVVSVVVMGLTFSGTAQREDCGCCCLI